MFNNCFTTGDQLVEDTLLQDGSEVFRVGGGKSVQIESSSHGDTHSTLLILRSSEGKIHIIITLLNKAQ